MSNDEFYVDSKKLLEEWILKHEFGLLFENINPSALSYIKKAFLDGYKLGFNKKTIQEWQEQNQK